MASVARILGSIFGVIFLVISVPMLIGGVVALSVPAAIADNQGYMNSPVFHLQSKDSYAFVSNSFAINTTSDHSSSTNNYNTSITLANVDFSKIVNFRFNADSYFIGLAPTNSVDNYLNNVPYSVVDEMNGQTIYSHLVNSNKNGTLVSSPSEQSFWLASGENVLYFTPSSSDFNKNMTLVIMQTDGSKGIDTNFQIGVNAPILAPIGVALLIFGTLFLVFAIIFIVVAIKSKDKTNPKRNVPIQQIYKPVTNQSEFFNATESSDQTYVAASKSVKYCSSCGTITDQQAHFCETCGSEFDN